MINDEIFRLPGAETQRKREKHDIEAPGGGKCPIGLLLNIAGAKTLLPRERPVLCELVENVRKRSRIARHGRGSSTPPGTSEGRPKGRASSLAGLCYTNTPSPPS